MQVRRCVHLDRENSSDDTIGIVQRAISLLQYDTTRKVALSVLAMVTQHKSTTQTAHDIILLSGSLAIMAHIRSEDVTLVELVLSILAQALRATLLTEALPSTSFMDRLELHSAIEVVYSILRRPRISYCMLSYAIDIAAAFTMIHTTHHLDIRALATFLGAFARCSNIRTRAIVVSSIMRLSAGDDEELSPSFSQARLEDLVNDGMPIHLADRLKAFGYERSEILLILESSYRFRCLMAEAEARMDDDLRTLGRELAYIVQLHEFAVGDKVVDDASRHPQDASVYTSWIYCLYSCAEALRRDLHHTTADLDAADILVMRFSQYRARFQDAVSVGRMAISRNPELAYAYLILSMQNDREDGLHMARRGLLCPDMTPFVRTQLLRHAAILSTHLGFSLLQSASPVWIERGTALVKAALDDTNTFLAEAPPDNSWMLLMLDWKVILTIIVQGPELSPGLLEFEVSNRSRSSLWHTILSRPSRQSLWSDCPKNSPLSWAFALHRRG